MWFCCKGYIITRLTAAAVRTELSHTKKPQITKSMKRKKNYHQVRFKYRQKRGIGEKNKLKLDPR